MERAGHVKLRACVYYGNVLLQSVLLEADATQGGERGRGGAAISRVTDYVASCEVVNGQALSNCK